jgi:hypothetical protein
LTTVAERWLELTKAVIGSANAQTAPAAARSQFSP